MKKAGCVFLITLFIVSAGIHAGNTTGYTSNYQQVPILRFSYGPPTSLPSSGSQINSLDFCALLGVVTITPNGNQLYKPNMYSLNMNANLFIEGYVRQSNTITYNNEIPVKIRAITVLKNSVEQSVIVQNGTVSLGKQNGNALQGADSFSVYLVLVNDQRIPNYFIPGTTYRLTDSSNVGTFQVGAATGNNSNPQTIDITLNGVNPQIDAPFIGDGGPPSSTPDIPYAGDFEFSHRYNFSIISHGGFDIHDALFGHRPTIATLQLEVLEAEPNKEYGVDIAFRSSNPSGFKLHLNGDLSQHGFDYRLYLEQQEIENNAFMRWRQLYTQNATMCSATKEVKVSIDPSEELNSAPEGLYRDTVTVFIVSLDTL
jgi:hypothetical protein